MIKPLGSTLLLTCQVSSGQELVDYNLQWTALTNDGVLRTITSRTGRLVLTPDFHYYVRPASAV